MLFIGATGIGKSVFVLMLVILWALGRVAFGIRPSGRTRTLIVQGENDEGDIAEMREGIYNGLKLTPADRDAANSAVLVVNESSLTGADFVTLFDGLVSQHKPDLAVVDPLNTFLGDSVNEQRAVSAFLRNGINPILQKNRCGLILVHHGNKPPSGSQRPDWKAGDFAYLGAGSAELANWARAMMVLRSIGSHDVFELILGKRGKRAGIVDANGNPIFSQHVKHSSTGICWESATEDEAPQIGRQAKFSPDQLIEVLRGKELTTAEWQREALETHAISRSRFFGLLAQLRKAKRVDKSPITEKWSLK